MDLNDLKEIIVLLALISLIGAATAIALSDFQTSIDRSSGTVVNESHTWTNATNMTLGFDEIEGITLVNCTGNASTGQGDWNEISSSLYVLFADAGKIQADSTTFLDDGMLACANYTFSVDNSAFNITGNGLRGVDRSTRYLDTTGTVAGVAVLIGIVILAFGVMARR